MKAVCLTQSFGLSLRKIKPSEDQRIASSLEDGSEPKIHSKNLTFIYLFLREVGSRERETPWVDTQHSARHGARSRDPESKSGVRHVTN